MIQGVRVSPYEDRIKLPILHSLKRRMVRRNMIKVFKWVGGANKQSDIHDVHSKESG